MQNVGKEKFVFGYPVVEGAAGKFLLQFVGIAIRFLFRNSNRYIQIRYYESIIINLNPLSRARADVCKFVKKNLNKIKMSEDLIYANIQQNIYSICDKRNCRSKVWEIFGEVKDENGEIVH